MAKENIQELEDTGADDDDESFWVSMKDVVEIYYTRCAEHALHLSCNDGLKMSAASKFVCLCIKEGDLGKVW